MLDNTSTPLNASGFCSTNLVILLELGRVRVEQSRVES